MSDEGWPADPKDPRCPECGEPVSATASYCLHCYADLPTAGGSTDDATSSTAPTTTASSPTTTTSTSDDSPFSTSDDSPFSTSDDSPFSTSDDEPVTGTSTTIDTSTTDDSTSAADTSTTAADTSTPTTDWSSFSTTAGEAAEGTAFRSTTAGGSATTRDDREAATSTEETGLLDPDGAVDNTVTVVVALFLGTLSAIVATVMVAFPLPGSLPFYAGLVTWLVVTGHAARSPSAQEATRRGCYAFAGLLIATPVLVGITAPMQDGTLAGRAASIVFFTLFVLPVASFFGVVGFLAGRAGDG